VNAADVDLSVPLARHAAQYPSGGLDGTTISHLQANLLDVIGVTLGGVTAAGLPELREFLRQTSSPGRSALLGTATRMSAPAAAFANAAAAHALEFDDAFDAGGGMHAGPVVHSVALAVADELGGLCGADYLGAVAVGLDVAVRLAAAPTADFGWHRASVFSVFGATVTAGRLIGLDAATMRHALGLALSQASGSRQSIRDGSLSTRLHTGFAARNAVTAAYLARSGFTGAAEIFDGPDGFIALFQRGEFRRELVLDGLGQQLQSSRISTKPFPGGRPTHALLEAALELRKELGEAEIEEVTVHAPAALAAQAGAPFPTTFAATYSLPYSVALALATGSAPVAAFVEPLQAPEAVRAAYAKIRIAADATGSSHGVIEVRDHRGRLLRRVADEASGGPSNPLSEGARLAKLWSLYEYSGRPFAPAALHQAISLVENMPELSSTSRLTRLLTAEPPRQASSTGPAGRHPGA
jgi:2-methylcitrate dehydratase PrpD